MDKLEGSAVGCGIFIWIISVILSLGVLGVAIWAIIELVQWVTSK